jgi:hypothetical protein
VRIVPDERDIVQVGIAGMVAVEGKFVIFMLAAVPKGCPVVIVKVYSTLLLVI